MRTVLDSVGKLIAQYLSKEVPGYEPFTPSDPEHLRGGLQHHDLAIGRHDAPRRGDAGCARPDHDDVGLAGQGRGGCAQDRHCGKARRRDKETAARDCHVMVSEDLRRTGTVSEPCRI